MVAAGARRSGALPPCLPREGGYSIAYRVFLTHGLNCTLAMRFERNALESGVVSSLGVPARQATGRYR